MAKAFAITFGLIVAIFIFIIIRTGYTKPVAINSGEQGPFVLVYKLHEGPYHKIAPVIDGVEKIYPVNQEIVTIRQKHPGEYIINLYFYDAVSSFPIPVDVKIDRVNPRYQTIYQETVELPGVDCLDLLGTEI